MKEATELDITGFAGELSSRLRVHLQPETVLNPEHDAIHPEDVLDAVCGIMDGHGYDTDRFCADFDIPFISRSAPAFRFFNWSSESSA